MGVTRTPDWIQIDKIIGHGSYGDVYKGHGVCWWFGSELTGCRADVRSGKVVAVKVVNLEDDHAGIDEIRREVSVLCHCDSPYVIKYHESFLVGAHLWIVMDYCGFGSLRQLIEGVGPIPEEVLPFIAKEVLKALAYLHDNRIIHRDVKAANILVTENGHLRLGDFGVASSIQQKRRRGSVAGSPYWMAPEVLSRQVYDSKADIWSFGIAMIELLTGNPPHHFLDAKQVILMRRGEEGGGAGLPRLEGPFSKGTLDFVNQCLQPEPESRPSAFELLKSRYFRGVKTHVAKSPLLALTKRLMMVAGEDAKAALHRPDPPNGGGSQWDFSRSPSE